MAGRVPSRCSWPTTVAPQAAVRRQGTTGGWLPAGSIVHVDGCVSVGIQRMSTGFSLEPSWSVDEIEDLNRNIGWFPVRPQ
ncbi:hypothetical protein ACLOJK_022716 [Asimina triloba]